MSKEIYRGYDLTPNDDGSVSIIKDGMELATATSKEAAYTWVDKERKEIARQAKQ